MATLGCAVQQRARTELAANTHQRWELARRRACASAGGLRTDSEYAGEHVGGRGERRAGDCALHDLLVRRAVRRERDGGARDGAGHGAVPPVVRPTHLRQAVGQAGVHASRESCKRRHPNQIEREKKILRNRA